MATSELGPRPATNVLVAYVSGALYLIIGLIGFAVTSGVGFADRNGKDLLLFEINPLHNIVHLLIGGLLIAGARGGLLTARRVNTLVGAVYLVVGVLGLVLLHSALDILALNWADNALHLGSAALLLSVGVRADLGSSVVTGGRVRSIR